MADTTPKSREKVASGAGWTDRERLAYLIILLDNSGVKIDFKASPLPHGRTIIACERMVGRLKTQYKDEIEAIKAGQPINDTAPKTPKKPKTTKRKAQPEEGDEDATPKTKRGRKAKDVNDEANVKDGSNGQGCSHVKVEPNVKEEPDLEEEEA
ncbi:hypothetical protein EJ04DRAFT_435056 [Polyplosphaeria fusca]|uniref:Uncharacterized protein n=1 Tax=Polyplosphaeria fusca TaxID=682080 RepID=A0A9P4R252_9PLEO|nr:hypothetical protein EJ04DRAFT_435056 [Polyplosphaeria fusca]